MSHNDSALDECFSEGVFVPRTQDFLNALTHHATGALFAATLICVGTAALAACHLFYIINYVPHPTRRLLLAYLACTAPIISILSLLTMYVPRVGPLTQLLGFLYFSFAFWVVILLLHELFGGHEYLVRKMAETSTHFSTATPPLCCCCPCLPEVPLRSSALLRLKLMVLQSPCLRFLATLLSLVIYFELTTSSFGILKVIDLLGIPSLLLGAYGAHMIVATVAKTDEVRPFRLVLMFKLLDIFLLFFGIQHPIFESMSPMGCVSHTLPSLESTHFWMHVAIISECLVVSLLSTLLLRPAACAFFEAHVSCRYSKTALAGAGELGITSDPFGTTSRPFAATSVPFGSIHGPFGTTSGPFGTTSGPFGAPSRQYMSTADNTTTEPASSISANLETMA